MIDDNREEHRMLIRLNDISPILASLIVGEEHGTEIPSRRGILKQRIHDKPYTITLYAFLKNYGMFPINRIKPRVRFSRKGYDDAASCSPVLFPTDARVDFVEFKHGEEDEKTDSDALQEIFADGPKLEKLLEDPAQLLVSQSDVFLMDPPVKRKTKVTGFASSGIPIGEFLQALNEPKKTVSIFKKYNGGLEFAKDLRKTLEEFAGLEFDFGIYSRYRRWDCLYAHQQTDAYRTTFDPYTTLGWVKSSETSKQLQPLTTERAARWEHKVQPENLDARVLKRIKDEILQMRTQYLIPRILSKSKTALTLLADWTESNLGLADELGYSFKLETPVKTEKVSSVKERKGLMRAFDDKYTISNQAENAVERHLNLAIGERKNMQYVLNNTSLGLQAMPETEELDKSKIIREPYQKSEIILSAHELRSRLPKSGFDQCYSQDICECGYIVKNKKSSRSYNVSFGKRRQGHIDFDGVSRDKPEHYVSIRYLGISPSHYKRKIVLPFTEDSDIESEVTKEMAQITQLLKEKRVI